MMTSTSRALLVAFITLVSLSATSANAQSTPAESMRTFERRMAFSLGTWAGANIVAGAVGWAATDDPEWRTFHQTNVIWNVINIPFALSLRPERNASDDPVSVLRSAESLKQALWFNAGLDIAYMATGFAIRELETRHAVRLRGVGSSFIVQGGWLLVFDVVGALRASAIARPLWEDVEIGLGSGGLQLSAVW